jgi:hypothetical protein
MKHTSRFSHDSDDPPAGSADYRGWGALIAACIALAIMWTVVFPWLSTKPPFAQHIQRMQEADIAVDAMFYTELNWQPPDGAAWRK